MTQAFYAIMGGYQICVPIEDNPFPGHHTHFLLNRESLQRFAEACPHGLKIAPDDEIKDESKANGLAKSLVCVQATWFIFQCISRMAMSLPITLLEVRYLYFITGVMWLIFLAAEYSREFALCTHNLPFLVT